MRQVGAAPRDLVLATGEGPHRALDRIDEQTKHVARIGRLRFALGPHRRHDIGRVGLRPARIAAAILSFTGFFNDPTLVASVMASVF